MYFVRWKSLQPLNKNNIITVGRLSDEKGVIDLIKVFNYINKLNPNITYNIIGDGQEKSNIEKEASQEDENVNTDEESNTEEDDVYYAE